MPLPPETKELAPIEYTKIVFEIVQISITSLAIIVGGLWAYFRFRIQREHQALIDFTVDIAFHKKIGKYWIVELVALVENRGKVQHLINDFTFNLYSLKNSDPVNLADEYNGQVDFINKLAEGSFIPKKRFNTFFVEPGLKNKYSYLTRVPEDAAVVVLHSHFKYMDGKRSHGAEKTAEVPNVNS